MVRCAEYWGQRVEAERACCGTVSPNDIIWYIDKGAFVEGAKQFINTFYE